MTSGGQTLVLNVNDADANRYALGRALQRAGIKVIEESSGVGALAALRRLANEIDLVLLDVHLPDLSGLEVCQRIKSDPATASILVVHISATAIDTEDRVLGLNNGADAYLNQNVHAPELVATINALLRMRRAEEKLRESEEQYRSLAESIPQMVWSSGPNGAAVFFNQQWYDYTGLSPEQALGTGWIAALHPDDRAADLDRWRKAVSTGSVYEGPVRLKRGVDQAYRWHLARALPLRDRAGGVTQWFGTYTDVDDQERARQALMESERRKNEFLAMLGHELRNPLSPLLSAAHLLRERSSDEKTVLHQAGVIERQVQHMVRLVDDLLDIARISYNRIEMRRDTIDLRSVIRNAVESCRPFAAQRQHEIIVVLPPDPILVFADAARLQQVLVNLLHNAIKYTNPPGRVRIEAEERGAQAITRVADNGIGILPEMLPRVFETFAQADRSLDRSEGGLGIGLTLVKQIVELHGGTVEAHSAGAEQGSVFEVRLPLSSAPSDVPVPTLTGDAAAAAPTPQTNPARSRRILIVEDNQDAAQTLSDILTIWGHEVRIAHDGREALRLAPIYRPDVVLLDVGLPGVDGYQVARGLRTQPELSGATIIAITGYGRDEDRQLAADAGFNIHLTKPIDPAALCRLFETFPEAPA